MSLWLRRCGVSLKLRFKFIQTISDTLKGRPKSFKILLGRDGMSEQILPFLVLVVSVPLLSRDHELAPSSMNGNSSWRSSRARKRHWARSERRRIERDLATSCFIGQPLARRANKRAIRAGLIVDAELNPVVVAE